MCGRLAIEGPGGALGEDRLPGRLGRRLWAYLVLHRRRAVARGELATALWGDAIPDAYDASLSALASRVRSAVAPVAADPAFDLRGGGGTYALALPPDTFVDRERAWAAIHHVRAIRARGEPRAAWAEAVIAHEIAARSFLPGEDGEWIEAERRVLADIELQALEAVVTAELDRAEPAEAERAARSLIARDPLRESGYRLLMQALAAGGNGAQCARVMAECRVALAGAGAAPSAETERTFRELVSSPRG